MNINDVDIHSIKPYENNPRLNNQSIEKVARSLKEFGWQQPIVVDTDMVIIVGHTRWEAAKLNGYDVVPITIASELSEKQARAYRLADNKVADYSIWDNKKLLDELKDLDDVFTGFDDSEIFRDVLDEKDNSPISENEAGVYYTGKFQVNDIEKFEQIKGLIDEIIGQ